MTDSSDPLPDRASLRQQLRAIAELRAVMRLMDGRLDEVVAALPARRRPLVPNALLNLAVERILAEEGQEATAAILQRLAELVASGQRPEGSQGFALSGRDA
jgi:hypothetical protein